jgi:hypothetical protein
MCRGSYAKTPEVPSDVEKSWSAGRCVYLALALHDRFGWPLRVQIETGSRESPFDLLNPSVGSYVAHAYVVHPSGVEIDVLGPTRQMDRFADTVRDVTRSDLILFVAATRGRREDGRRAQGNPIVEVERGYREEKAAADQAIDRYVVPRLRFAGLIP